MWLLKIKLCNRHFTKTRTKGFEGWIFKSWARQSFILHTPTASDNVYRSAHLSSPYTHTHRHTHLPSKPHGTSAHLSPQRDARSRPRWQIVSARLRSVREAAVDPGAAEWDFIYSHWSGFSPKRQWKAEALIGLGALPLPHLSPSHLSHSFFLTFSCTSVSSHPPPPPPPPLNMPLPGLCSFIQLLWGHVWGFVCKVTCVFLPLQDTEFVRRHNRCFRAGHVLRVTEHSPKNS